ncbi:MAG: guanylate kinase [Acidimicrobiales bacterium]
MLIGPGGAGKGTVSRALVERDPRLWLSRSWTTRPPRPGEPKDAYVYVDAPAFTAKARRGGFLEWAEFLGHLYGTPLPEPPRGKDVLLEIDIQGARQVRERLASCLVVMLVPPSDAVQRSRLQERGDPPDKVDERIAKGRQEIAEGEELASAIVVNDEVDRATTELAGIVEAARSARLGRL